MGTRIATDETREAIKTAARQHGGLAGLVRHLIAEYPDMAKDDRAVSFYSALYDAKRTRAMSYARENQVRFWLGLPSLAPPPVKRVAIDPTTEGVRKLPGHGDGKETLRTWRTTDPKQAAKLDAKLAADGFSGLQDMVDQYIAKNGSEAA